MLKRLRARQPGQPLYRILWWYVCWLPCFLWMHLCYRYKAVGVANIPSTGPVLMISNHQSTLDPIVVGVAGHRRQMAALARASLFKNPVFGWLIRSINAIPVERGTADTRAMRQAIDVLKRDQALLVFAEGTRTLDGTTKAFAPGTMLLIRRAKPMVLPIAIEGAFDAYPRGRRLPKLFGRISIAYGEPVAAEELLAMDPEAALAYLRDRVESMRLALAEGGEPEPRTT